LKQRWPEMKKNPLIETNPYLKNLKNYRKALLLNVASSTAIETGVSVESIYNALSGQATEKPIKERLMAPTTT
jgi:hypothetical protein